MLANVTHIAFGRGSIRKTYSVRLRVEDSFRNPNVVAMGTIDRDAWLVFLNLPDFSTRFLLGGLLFLKGNRVTSLGFN